MAMSGDATTDWAHFYALGSHPSSASAMFGHGPAESTVVTTAAAPAAAAAAAAPAAGGCGPQMGRAGKTARRRSRASRRAPTTLLNTDTANFRAMVQQFTGIPSGPPAHLPPSAGPVINFGPMFGDSARPAPTVVSFGHVQPPQQQPSYMDQFHYSRPVFTQDLYNSSRNNNNNNNDNNNNNNNNTGGGKNDEDHIYVHGYSGGGGGGGGSVSSAPLQAEMGEGFMFDQMMLPKTSAPSANSRVDGYFS